MFANGWAVIAGIAALALPFVIHWLTKPRPVRVPVSTLKFIQGALAERRAKYRLRDFIVLFCRAAALLLFALAVARPLLSSAQQQTVADEDAAVTRVVLLDCSQSMGARDGGVIRFESARSVAQEQLAYESDLTGNLLLAGASPSAVFETVTTNLASLRKALAEANVKAERLRVQEALNTASELLASASPESRLELVVISDFQRTNWASADFSVLPEACQTTLKSVASETAPANISVEGFEVIGPAVVGRDADIAVTVGNYSETPTSVKLEVEVGRLVVPLGGVCQVQSTTTFTGRVPVPEEGWLSGEVRLVSIDDSLPADNIRPLTMQINQSPRVAIVSRDSPTDRLSSAWYLKQALGIVLNESDQKRQFFVNTSDPDLELLKTADIVILARPGRLSEDLQTVLKAGLQRGRGILYVASDQLDAVNLTELTESLGSSLRMPVDYLPRPSERAGQQRILTSVNRRTVPFDVFGDDLPAAMKSLQFTGGLISRPRSDGLADDVRGALDDQSAFLSVTAAGRGRLAVLNADLQRSNLAKTPVLIPLLGELMARELSGFREVDRRFLCGEAFATTLDAGEEMLDDLTITGPDGDRRDTAERFEVTAGGIAWDAPPLKDVGVYELTSAGETLASVSVEIPAEESDLRTLSADVFEGRLSGGRQLSFQQAGLSAEDAVDTTWVWMAVGCLCFLILELLTLKFFRS